MTLETALAWSIARSLLVTTVAVPISYLVWRLISATQQVPRLQGLVVAVAVVPLFVPDLLTGFTYRMTSARLLHSEAATELLYAALLVLRICALQVAVRIILPSATVSREALHSWKLVQDGSTGWWWSWCRLYVQGPLRTPLIAWIGGALFCFQEFETAALLQINRHPIAWSVWLFDAHAAGEPLSRSLLFVTEAMAFQGVLLLPIVLLLPRGGLPTAIRQTGTSMSRVRPAVLLLAVCVLCAALGVYIGWPLWINGVDTWRGLHALAGGNALASRVQQILYSMCAATMAAVLALQLACRVISWGVHWLTVLAVVPGLCGSLVVSLTLLAVFQLTWLNVVYDSWLPMIMAATVLMLPRAVLLILLLEVLVPPTSVHAAGLLRTVGGRVGTHGRTLVWQLARVRWLIATAVLTHWCLWDVAVASTLRPVRFEPIVVRLYNEMHYGRTESLVAITLLALVIPVILLCVAAGVWKRLPDLRKV